MGRPIGASESVADGSPNGPIPRVKEMAQPAGSWLNVGRRR
jgi:hypothetical protein